MKFLYAIILLSAIILPLHATYAQQKPNPIVGYCGIYEEMVEKLNTKFHQYLMGQGISTGNILTQIFTGPNNNNWTVLIITAQEHDKACIASMGHSWVQRDNSEEDIPEEDARY